MITCRSVLKIGIYSILIVCLLHQATARLESIKHICEELMQTTRELEVVPNLRHRSKAFASGRKLSLDTDILCYWKTYSLDNELRKLAEVVLAVPATPVSVGIKRFITNFK